MIGVYKIDINGKIYVGSTSRDFSMRWSAHLYALRKGTHFNPHIQNAYNKYGESSLKFSVLEVVETPKEVISFEQKYIDDLEPEYNICKVAGSMLGVKCRPHTAEAKLKMSIANLGKKHSEATKLKMSATRTGMKRKPFTDEAKINMGLARIGLKTRSIKITCLNTGETFNTIKDAVKLYKISPRNIRRHLKGEKEFAGQLSDGIKLSWKYAEL